MLCQEIFEDRSSPLFHVMDYEKAINIFDGDEMEGRWEHNIPNLGLVNGNSFSRNPNLAFSFRPVKIKVDKGILAYTNKIIPLDGERIWRYTTDNNESPNEGKPLRPFYSDRLMNSGKYVLAEEFVLGDIKNLHRCITKVQLNFTQISGAEAINLKKCVTNYCNKFGIELEIDPKFEKFVQDTEESWALDD